MSPKIAFRDKIPPRQNFGHNSFCVNAPISSAITDRANFFTWPCWHSWPTRELSRLRHEVLKIASCSTPRLEHLGTEDLGALDQRAGVRS
jgi:hypothetical protein